MTKAKEKWHDKNERELKEFNEKQNKRISELFERKKKDFESSYEKTISTNEKLKLIETELEEIKERLNPTGRKYSSEGLEKIDNAIKTGYKRAIKHKNLFDFTFSPFTDLIIQGAVLFHYEDFLVSKRNELTSPPEITEKQKSILLHWEGNNNQLYDVIRQLKERGNISNSYTDLAVFLKFNFDNFSNTSLSTIETELQRGKRPTKAKRINLPNDIEI